MSAAPLVPESGIHFDEPVRVLLGSKDQTRSAWSISPEATVYDAIERMAENHLGALVVLSAEKLNGLVSERDCARKVILKGRQTRETRVHEIMSKSVYYVHPETTADECIRLMTAHRVAHLPVLGGEGVIGMVSMGELADWITKSQERALHQLESSPNRGHP